MPSDKLKNQLHLHFIVFIWGFTAILGALITINAMSLVWYRVLLASITLFIYLKYKKIPFNDTLSDYFKFIIGGILIALHWFTFFYAIKISNISTTLVTMSSSAVFLVLLQPLFDRKNFSFTELFLSIITIIGFVIIFKVDGMYINGIIFGLISAFLLAIFSMFNNKLAQKYLATKIAFYELFAAFLFLTVVLFFNDGFDPSFFVLTNSDWFYIVILATLCTAYPFVVATDLLRKMGTFTIVLTNNLEPVYGIILAVIIFGDKEKMSLQFYIGAVLIISSVLLNAIIKNKLRFTK
jgi:drug/metabolite transporter (DMT)-like permease